jgi:hypothetical protein
VDKGGRRDVDGRKRGIPRRICRRQDVSRTEEMMNAKRRCKEGRAHSRSVGM